MLASEVAAIIAFAISGLVEARRRRADVVGLFVVAFVTAFGGGTLRDLLLDRRPFFWVEHQEYVWALFGIAVLAKPLLGRLRDETAERAILIPDAIGMGMFSANGALLAVAAGLPPLPAAMIGVVSGVFGGVLRDVLLNEMPVIFRDGRPYALCAFAGAGAALAMAFTEAPEPTALLAGIAVAAGTRLAAVWFDWRLPT